MHTRTSRCQSSGIQQLLCENEYNRARQKKRFVPLYLVCSYIIPSRPHDLLFGSLEHMLLSSFGDIENTSSDKKEERKCFI